MGKYLITYKAAGQWMIRRKRRASVSENTALAYADQCVAEGASVVRIWEDMRDTPSLFMLRWEHLAAGETGNDEPLLAQEDTHRDLWGRP
jgi:hypothetical protein